LRNAAQSFRCCFREFWQYRENETVETVKRGRMKPLKRSVNEGNRFNITPATGDPAARECVVAALPPWVDRRAGEATYTFDVMMNQDGG
jgi:hypothetical protein